MKILHVVIPDLFLPAPMAAYTHAELCLPATQKLLARATSQPLLPAGLEQHLCAHFALPADSVAPITAAADGLETGSGYWLRADPILVQLQKDQMILQARANVTAAEAHTLCAALNQHFHSDGLQFFAPHPQRWYLHLRTAPQLATHALTQAIGTNIPRHLPHGAEALRWHSWFNEIQMLFFEHPVNLAREARGAPPINGVWFWGGGIATPASHVPFVQLCGDDELTRAFAHWAGIPLQNGALDTLPEGTTLWVWNGLSEAIQAADLDDWRSAVMQFETQCAAPALAALQAGKFDQLRLDVLHPTRAQRFSLTRRDAWKVWRGAKKISAYSAEFRT
jgi:hypothetical protein